jgi:uncharacterized lipoprotein YajG
MLKRTFLIASVMLFVGCSSQNNTTVPKQNQEPQWLLDPYIDNDKFAAVGCAQRHIKGISAQKDLAISRAIDRIATQNGVTVENVTMREKTTSNGRRGSSSSKSSSLHTVSEVTVSTKTKAIYKNNDGEICVWVVSR